MKNSFIINTGGVKTNFDMLFKQMLMRKKKQQQPSPATNGMAEVEQNTDLVPNK
jgi:hypothetical protein